MKSPARLALIFGSFLWCLRIAAAAPDQTAASTEAPRPHVVFILADDLGWADVGFHGGNIKTPQLDRLAAAGARLEQFYVQPVCSPTRAALLTGRYPMRLGLQVGVIRPWAQYGLDLEERTLPQALKGAGYVTAITGKWHLGQHDRAYLPTRRGFDHQYGHYSGAIDYFTHQRDGGHDWHRDDRANYDQGYSTALVAREAVRLITEHETKRPLFLYVPFNAVHAPHQVPDRYKEPYQDLPEPRRTYAGMVAAMDEAVGEIVAALDKKGMRSQTLILFSSDNGGPQPGKVTSNGPLRAGKGTLYEGGTRVPAFAVWDDHIPAGSVVDAPIHIVDWYPTLLRLAGVSLQQDRPLDGLDMWATISRGAPSPRREVLYNTQPGSGALRLGDWKLVLHGLNAGADSAQGSDTDTLPARRRARNQPTSNVELFDLARDPYEKTNLAESYPDKLKELRARYDQLAAEAAPPRKSPDRNTRPAPKIWGEPER